MIGICFHGAESTGKTTLARKLGADFGFPVVREYGRTYAEARGPDFTMASLLDIARKQDQLRREAEEQAAQAVLLDTDPLMTAAWAEMLFGQVPDELLAYPKADLYVLFAPDVPWVDDGTRCFGGPATRMRFAAIAEDILRLAGVTYRAVGGDWTEREREARGAIEALVQASR